jgi:class 3 adenylate cyclase/TM2 domain-containing membrane protein YozV
MAHSLKPIAYSDNSDHSDDRANSDDSNKSSIFASLELTMPEEKQKIRKRLAAIMFTDIVGYSTIMEKNEVAGAKIRQRHKEVIEATSQKYEGDIIQYFGDGTLSVFPSAAAAVECAVEMQREFGKSPHVPLRIGIHTGDITYGTEEAYGHGMNIAARIEPLCISGGVYVSGKVYDDIRNHNWLKAESLGLFNLKNIKDEVEIYAISNEGVKVPEKSTFEPIKPASSVIPPPVRRPYQPSFDYKRAYTSRRTERKRKFAAVLALILGVFGIHRFYLGQQGLGFAYLIPSLIGMMSNTGFMTAIPAIIGIVDAYFFFTMSDGKFNARYNRGPSARGAVPIPVTSEEPEDKKEKSIDTIRLEDLPLRKRAYARMYRRDYKGAIQDFREVLESGEESGDLHFALACCHSLNEDTEEGFYHLSKAVELGYRDFQKIKSHFSLAFLRSRKEFPSFVENGYKLVRSLPAPQEDLLSTERPLLLKKLERIEQLGDLKEKGEITEEQFQIEKNKLLREE